MVALILLAAQDSLISQRQQFTDSSPIGAKSLMQAVAELLLIASSNHFQMVGIIYLHVASAIPTMVADWEKQSFSEFIGHVLVQSIRCLQCCWKILHPLDVPNWGWLRLPNQPFLLSYIPVRMPGGDPIAKLT